jgi:hypothetical protein
MSLNSSVLTRPGRWYVLEQTYTSRHELVAGVQTFLPIDGSPPLRRIKVQQVLERGVNVKRRGQLPRVKSQIAHFVRVLVLERLRHANAEKWKSLNKIITDL